MIEAEPQVAKTAAERKHNFRDLKGQKFGRLTVESEAPKRGRFVRWNCRCECGKSTTLDACQITSGKTKSCGCLRTELQKQRCTTHGKTRTPEYYSWAAMRDRCLCPTNQAYARYGGRGIKISPRWDNFANFLSDMGPRPSPQHSIDRYPRNDGDYEPANCRWATAKQQANNRRPKNEH